MEAVNGVSEGDKGGPQAPSPLTGCYLLIIVGEPHSKEHKDIILRRIAKGLLSWDITDCHVDLEKELAIITEQAPEGEDAKYGERLIQIASENLVTEILIHPTISTLSQCMKNLLSSFTRHRHIVHAGYTFAANGSWILQDGTYSLTDFSEAFQEMEVQRIIRAYDNSISLDIHCSPEGDWTRLPKEPFTKNSKVRVNPNDVLTSGSPSIVSFLDYIYPFLAPADIETLLEGSEVVGNIRFSHPTLYVFPGGQGDAALFGINGFNMLVDGGFGRKACFWDFVRHLDRLDAVLLTRLNNSNVNGISSVLRRKRCNSVYPQIGHFFSNIQERKSILSPDGDKDKDPLIINLIEEGHEIVSNLRQLNLQSQPCYREVEPINLYHKVGHGTLDMYVLSPTKDSKEVREFIQKWNSNDQRLFANQRNGKDFTFPVQNLVSICALLVWQPANASDSITRILFPGSTPQQKIFEGLDRLKQLECIKYPSCSAKTLMPNLMKSKPKTEKSIQQEQKEYKPKEKLAHQPEMKNKIENKVAEENIKNSQTNGVITEQVSEKIIKKHDSTESEKSGPHSGEIKKQEVINLTNGKPTEEKPMVKSKVKIEQKTKIESKVIKQTKTIERKPRAPIEKKASPTTPKKTLESKVNGDALIKPKVPTKVSPSATPAKSAKEANNRKVVESKYKTPPKREVSKPEKKEVKERKPISRRPKESSPIGKVPESPAKKLSELHKIETRKSKLEKEGTTDSSTVSTPTADADTMLKKDLSKLTPEEFEQLNVRELAELKEEQEVVKEIEAVFRKGETTITEETDARKVKNISLDDKTEPEGEEYLIVEKEEVEHDSLEEKEAQESETKKHHRDSEESEKQRKLSDDVREPTEIIEEKIITTKVEHLEATQTTITTQEGKEQPPKEISVTSPDDKGDVSSGKKNTDIDEENKDMNVLESQPDEKFSTPIESGATTAPTLPEDERITLDEIKEDNGDQVIEEKYVKEDTKEKDIPVIQLPQKLAEPLAKLPTIAGIRLDKQTPIRDLVKTPDEVADLPVHEEVDIENYEHYQATNKPEEGSQPANKHEETDTKKATEEKIVEAETVDVTLVAKRVEEEIPSAETKIIKVEEIPTATIAETENLLPTVEIEKGDLVKLDEVESKAVKDEGAEKHDDLVVAINKDAVISDTVEIDKLEEKTDKPEKEIETETPHPLDEETKWEMEHIVDSNKPDSNKEIEHVDQLVDDVADTAVAVEETTEELVKELVEVHEEVTKIADIKDLKHTILTGPEENEVSLAQLEKDSVPLLEEQQIDHDTVLKQEVNGEEEKIDKEKESVEALVDEIQTETITILHEEKSVKTETETIKIETIGDKKAQETPGVSEPILHTRVAELTSALKPISDDSAVDESHTDTKLVETAFADAKDEIPTDLVGQSEDNRNKEKLIIEDKEEDTGNVLDNVDTNRDSVEIKETVLLPEDHALVDEIAPQIITKDENIPVEESLQPVIITKVEEQEVVKEEIILADKTAALEMPIIKDDTKATTEMKDVTISFLKMEQGEIVPEIADPTIIHETEKMIREESKLLFGLPEEIEISSVIEPLLGAKHAEAVIPAPEIADTQLTTKLDDKELLKSVLKDSVDLNKLDKILQDLKDTVSEKQEPEQPVEIQNGLDIVDKLELGRKSPKEREQDVAIIVASVAEVLKSDAPLEEFEGKIPLEISTFSSYPSYTEELRETHITTVHSPIEEKPISNQIQMHSITEEKNPIALFLDEERKVAPLHSDYDGVQNGESRVSSLMKDSNDLIHTTSKIISDIKQSSKIDEDISATSEKSLEIAKETNVESKISALQETVVSSIEPIENDTLKITEQTVIPDIFDQTETKSRKASAEIIDLIQTPIASGKSSPDIAELILKATVDTVKALVSSGKSSPELKETAEAIDLQKPLIKSGKSTPEITDELKDAMQSEKSSPELLKQAEELTTEMQDTIAMVESLIASGKTSPDVKIGTDKRKSSPELKDTIETHAPVIVSGKSSPEPKEPFKDTIEAHAPVISSGKSSPDPKELLEDVIESHTSALLGKAGPGITKSEFEVEEVSEELKVIKSMVLEDSIEKSSPDKAAEEEPVSTALKEVAEDLIKITESVIGVEVLKDVEEVVEESTIKPVKSSADLEILKTDVETVSAEFKDFSTELTEMVENIPSIAEVEQMLKDAVETVEASVIKSEKSSPDMAKSVIDVEAISTSLQEMSKDLLEKAEAALSGENNEDIKEAIEATDDSLLKSGKTSPDVTEMKTEVEEALSVGLTGLTKELAEIGDTITTKAKDILEDAKETVEQVLGISDHENVKTESAKSTDIKDLSKDAIKIGEEIVTETEKSISEVPANIAEGINHDAEETVEPIVLATDIKHLTKSPVSSEQPKTDITDALESEFSKDGSGKATPELQAVVEVSEEIHPEIIPEELPASRKSSQGSAPELEKTKTDESVQKLDVTIIEKAAAEEDKTSGKTSPIPEISEQIRKDSVKSPLISGQTTPEIKETHADAEERKPVTEGTSEKDLLPSEQVQDSLVVSKSPIISERSTPDIVIHEESPVDSGRSTPDIKEDIAIPELSKDPIVEKGDAGKIASGKATPDLTTSGETTPDLQAHDITDSRKSSIQEPVKEISTPEIQTSERASPDTEISDKGDSSVVEVKHNKIDPATSEVRVKIDSVPGPSTVSPIKSSVEDTEYSRKSTPDIADLAKDKEEETGIKTPPTVPVSPIIKEKRPSAHDQDDLKNLSQISLTKLAELRSSTPLSDDCDISSGQVSRILTAGEDEDEDDKHVYSDEEDLPGSPLSATSQVPHSTSSQYDLEDSVRGIPPMDPMSTSFYGALPDEPIDLNRGQHQSDSDFEKALQEHRQARGEDLTSSPSHVYAVTTAKFSSGKLHEADLKSQEAASSVSMGLPKGDIMSSSFIGSELPVDPKSDPIASWGKPLGLPSPAPLSDNKGTPKKERKIPANVVAKNKFNEDKKLLDSKYDRKGRKTNPIYVDLTYVPHHGNSNYSYVDFFKRVRARYYVFSGLEPSREVYNALLEAKQTWDDKELEVTIIPTYDTDVLGYWVAENEELLGKCKIDLSPSASRCTINLQDHETSCSAYRLEFS